MVDLRTADGELLHAEVWPGPDTGDWLVVAHGFSGSTGVPALRRAAERLARSVTVLAYDARGHGRSTGRTTLGDREVLDVDAAVAHARASGARRVGTLGFSMGAAAVVRHAAGVAVAGRRPAQRTDAVVVVSGTGDWSTWATATRAMRLLHLLVGSPPGRLVARTVMRTRVVSRAWASAPLSPAACVASVDAPLLLVHGDRDRYLRLEHAELLAAPSGAPLWVEAGMGHAEVAVGPELLDRIGAHLVSALHLTRDDVADRPAR